MPSMLYVGLQDADKIAVLSIDDSGKFSKQSEAAAANYRRAAWADKMRRAYRAAVARFTEWCPVHPADRAAGVAADSCRLSGG